MKLLNNSLIWIITPGKKNLIIILKILIITTLIFGIIAVGLIYFFAALAGDYAYLDKDLHISIHKEYVVNKSKSEIFEGLSATHAKRNLHFRLKHNGICNYIYQ